MGNQLPDGPAHSSGKLRALEEGRGEGLRGISALFAADLNFGPAMLPCLGEPDSVYSSIAPSPRCGGCGGLVPAPPLSHVAHSVLGAEISWMSFPAFPAGLGRAERKAGKRLLIPTCLTLYRKGFQKSCGPMEMPSTQRCILSFTLESEFSLLPSPLIFWWHSLLPEWF